jgi:hypothetical protein
METCKSIVLDGSRKGLSCQFPPSDNGYCGRHQRNFQHEQLLKDGKIPCLFFFRGCDAILTEKGSCDDCKKRICKKTTDCGHEGCKFKTKGDKYCKKHSRDIYRDEEKEKGIHYCDIDRGCFTVCKEGYTTCDTCREESYKKEKEIRQERVELHNALKNIPNSIKQLCVNCGKDYEQFKTRFNKPSKICKSCNQYNAAQDIKRSGRIRNYKNEHFRNLGIYFKDYISSATTRNYTIGIQFDNFKQLVLSQCYYCQYFKDEEINGIDRLDNSKGYEKDNCVPCCETCNMMKHTYHPLFFIELCKIISGFDDPKPDFYEKWTECYKLRPVSYNKYKKHSEETRKLPFHITKEEWNTLIKKPCYLCGFKSTKGIGLDRVDNTRREYTLDNVKPCCYSCNVLKKDFTLAQVKEKALLVSSIWTDTTPFHSIPL